MHRAGLVGAGVCVVAILALIGLDLVGLIPPWPALFAVAGASLAGIGCGILAAPGAGRGRHR